MDERKRTRGRQKIVMKKIEREKDRYATFSKRRQGVFKKASEVSSLCEADVGVFIFSPTGKPFSFFHPSMDAVLSGFGPVVDVVQDDASRLVEACSRARVVQINQMIHRVGVKLEEEEEREKQLDDAMREKRYRWEEAVIESLGMEEVEDLIALLQNMQSKLSHQRHKANNAARSGDSVE